MLDVPCTLESQWYRLWQCLQAAASSTSLGKGLKSNQTGEVLLLPLTLGLLHLVVGGGGGEWSINR